MASREYGAAIFSPGLGEILLLKHTQESGWAFPFSHTTESDVHVVAAASAVRQLLGVDIGDKISRTHWIEVEFPETGALVRLYVALGIKPEMVTPRCAPGAVAKWHPLRSILPPVNAILRTDAGAAGGFAGDTGEDEEGGSLMLEAGIAPFLAKLKALLNKHPEWRIAQLDPHLTRLIQAAAALPTNQPSSQQQPELNKSSNTTTPKQDISASQTLPPSLDQQQHEEQPQTEGAWPKVKLEGASAHADKQPDGSQTEEAAGGSTAACGENGHWAATGGPRRDHQPGREVAGSGPEAARQGGDGKSMQDAPPGMSTGDGDDGGEGEGSGGEDATGWHGPRAQEHLLEYCRKNCLPEPCYSLVVKKSARRPLVTASCILSHLGVTITPDMHIPGGINAACQAAALAALLWLEGALPDDGGEAVRVVPVGWPPLLSEARGEAWEAAQMARKAGGARRELDTAQREALLREMDKKRQRLVEEAAELERLMAALRGGGGVPETDISRLAAELGLGSNGSNGCGGDSGSAVPVEGGATAASPAHGSRGAKRSADGGDANGDGTGSLTVGLQALQFRSISDRVRRSPVPGAGGGGFKGAAGGRAPGTKRPREDGGMAAVQGGEGTPMKSVVMELKEFCDRKRWPQPQYSYSPSAGPGAAATVKLPPVAGLGDFSSGPQSNRKRAKEAAAAAALAQLSALGLK